MEALIVSVCFRTLVKEAARVNLSMRTTLLSSSSLQSRERFVFRASKALLAPLQQRKAQCHKQPGCLG